MMSADITGGVPDLELDLVEQWFRSQKNLQERLISTIRQSLDEVIDGPRTGRFIYAQCEKTEKTYLGTKVEILLRSEFGLDHGEVMDYRVDGIEVDCKYTGSSGGWNIPREAVGHICLLVRANDTRGLVSAGLIRCTEEILNKGQNQDGKRTISAASREYIRWLCEDAPLPVNQLYLWSEDDIARIRTKPSGQQRLNELFRLKQGEIIERSTIATIAQAKDDPMKRVRANGGARTALQPEGIIILGHQKTHPSLCEQLGLPVPHKGQVVSVRVVRDRAGTCCIAGENWRRAGVCDAVEEGPSEY